MPSAVPASRLGKSLTPKDRGLGQPAVGNQALRTQSGRDTVAVPKHGNPRHRPSRGLRIFHLLFLLRLRRRLQEPARFTGLKLD